MWLLPHLGLSFITYSVIAYEIWSPNICAMRLFYSRFKILLCFVYCP